MSKKIENEKKDYTNELITSNGEDEYKIKEDECYGCTKCSSNIEILDLDETNNIISFQCPIHNQLTMTIKEYFQNMPQNSFLFSKCSSCKKQQNEINNKEIFKFCFNCKSILCNKCIFEHNKNHLFIGNNQLSIKCPTHYQNNNKSFCIDCNTHLCEDCMKQRKHMKHKKVNIIEIEPSYEEINTLLKLINEYKNNVSNAKIEKHNKLIELETKYNKDKEKAKEEYNKIIVNSKINLKNELKKNEKKFYDEVNKLKEKMEKENKIINEKYKQIDDNNKTNFDKTIDTLDKNYKNEIYNTTILIDEKINHYNELLKINEIIYNTYDKYRENYYHNKNIINLLLNYYEKGNNILKEIKNNNEFIEAQNQKKIYNSIIKNYENKDNEYQNEKEINIKNDEEKIKYDLEEKSINEKKSENELKKIEENEKDIEDIKENQDIKSENKEKKSEDKEKDIEDIKSESDSEEKVSDISDDEDRFPNERD